MKFKKEYLDKRLFLLGKIREVRFIELELYPIIYKEHPYLFEVENKKKGK